MRRRSPLGLVTPLGTAADTGIAGLTLGGGQGRLMRTLRTLLRQRARYEIVTADGKVLNASARRIPIFTGVCVAAAATSAS